MKPNMSPAHSKRAQKLGSPQTDLPHACSGPQSSSDCEEKRDLVRLIPFNYELPSHGA